MPHRDSVFSPELHEAMIGCPEEGMVHVKLTVFPGYLVSSSNRVLEKALVYTERTPSTVDRSSGK